jgi:uncharacterized MAPEG superfamily protein
MTIFAGSIEVRMLCWAVVLGLAQLLVATALATKDQGLAYNLSPRDLPPPAVGKLAARMLRAFSNFKETFVFFAVAILAVTLTGRNNAGSALGAQLYFWARLVYVPVYAAGIPALRTAIWAVSIVGIVMVLAQLWAPAL